MSTTPTVIELRRISRHGWRCIQLMPIFNTSIRLMDIFRSQPTYTCSEYGWVVVAYWMSWTGNIFKEYIVFGSCEWNVLLLSRRATVENHFTKNCMTDIMDSGLLCCYLYFSVGCRVNLERKQRIVLGFWVGNAYGKVTYIILQNYNISSDLPRGFPKLWLLHTKY